MSLPQLPVHHRCAVVSAGYPLQCPENEMDTPIRLRATSPLFAPSVDALDPLPDQKKTKRGSERLQEVKQALKVVAQRSMDQHCPQASALCKFAKTAKELNAHETMPMESRSVYFLKTDNKHLFAVFQRALLGRGSAKEVFLAIRMNKATVPEEGGDRLYTLALGEEKSIEKERIGLVATRSFPGILRCIAVGPFDHAHYLVTPYCDGGEFTHLHQCRDTTRIRRLLRESAESLSTLHCAGFVHHDITPRNLLIRHDHAIVADLESAEFAERQWAHFPNGTVSFNPPEIGREQHLGPPRDIWAFGCVAYQILTGGTPLFPWQGQQEMAVAWKIMNITQEEIDQLIATAPNAAPEAKEFLQSILRVNPSERPSLAQVINHPFLAD